MNVEEQTVEFEPYPMRRRAFVNADAGHYCVWTTSGESKEIKADTAFEAFRKSGFTAIIKIERLSNRDKSVLDRSLVTDVLETSESSAQVAADSIQFRIRRRKNPILPPDEMDELMQAFKNQSMDQDVPEDSDEIQLLQESSLTPMSAEHHPVPLSVPTSPEAETLNPVGLDVHGDGFDEIIPAAHSMKPVVSKNEAPKELSPSAALLLPMETSVIPDRELSSEEVAELLEGK